MDLIKVVDKERDNGVHHMSLEKFRIFLSKNSIRIISKTPNMAVATQHCASPILQEILTLEDAYTNKFTCIVITCNGKSDIDLNTVENVKSHNSRAIPDMHTCKLYLSVSRESRLFINEVNNSTLKPLKCTPAEVKKSREYCVECYRAFNKLIKLHSASNIKGAVYALCISSASCMACETNIELNAMNKIVSRDITDIRNTLLNSYIDKDTTTILSRIIE